MDEEVSMTCVDAKEKEVDKDQWMSHKLMMTCVEDNQEEVECRG